MSGLHTVALWTVGTTCLSHIHIFRLLDFFPQLLFCLPEQWKNLNQRADHIRVKPVLSKHNNAHFLVLIAEPGVIAQYHCWKGRPVTTPPDSLSDPSSPASSLPVSASGQL